MTRIPTQVTFDGLTHRDDIEADIRERVRWLEHFYSGIVLCHVLVQVPHRHHRAGRHFHIGIELTVAGGAPIVISHDPSVHGRSTGDQEVGLTKQSEIDGERRYARAAIHSAFDAARRKLEDFSRDQRGAVKLHSAAS
jgi:hypothetical protein